MLIGSLLYLWTEASQGHPVLGLSYEEIDLKKFLSRILKSRLSLKSCLSILWFAIQVNGSRLLSSTWVASHIHLASFRNVIQSKYSPAHGTAV